MIVGAAGRWHVVGEGTATRRTHLTLLLSPAQISLTHPGRRTCQYQGKVAGRSRSSVSLSACHGLVRFGFHNKAVKFESVMSGIQASEWQHSNYD